MRVPNLITAEFLLCVKSQFKTNLQNTLHVNQDKSDRERVAPFQSSRGAVLKGLTDIKNESAKSFFIFIWSWIYQGC